MENKLGAIIIEGHVQGLTNTRTLGEQGVPVIVLDSDECIAQYSKYCVAYYRCPEYSTMEFIDFLIDLGERENLHGWSLFPSNDHIVFNLSKNLDRIKKIYKTLAPSEDVLTNIYNKQRLLNIAEITGVPYPATFDPELIDSKPFNLRFPVILKGKFGMSFYKTFKKKAFIVKDRLELLNTFAFLFKEIKKESFFIQEIIPDFWKNKTISFTAFSIEGEIKSYWCGIKLREHPWTFGTGTFAKSITPIDELVESSKKLLSKLNYTGICEIEYIYHPIDKKYMLIEINARTWLWVGLAKYCGINHTLYAYNYLNNIPNEYPSNYQSEIKWRNFYTDLFYPALAFLKFKLNLFDYIKSITHGKVIDAVRSDDDPKPFRAMTRMLYKLSQR